MSDFGFASWDANGVPNNYGIKPVTVVGIIDLALGQKTGSYQFNLEPGLKVGFAVGTLEDKGTISYTDTGNTITIQPSGSDGINDYPAVKVQLIVFAETA